MSKTKKNDAPHYEMLYLISNQFSENELKSVIEKVEAIITSNEGAITLRQTLGKKRLAYKIKQFRHGYYELIEFDAPSAALSKINELLRLSSDVLRHQIIKCEPKTPGQLEKEARVMNELIKAEEEVETQETKSAVELRVKKTETVIKPTEAGAVKTEATTETKTLDKDDKKLELSDLDDKLNQILDTDNLL